MKALEEVDPGLIDQSIRRVLAMARAPDREAMIAHKLSSSAELDEWVDILVQFSLMPHFDPDAAQKAVVLSAVAVGLEVGYALGMRESQRTSERQIPDEDGAL